MASSALAPATMPGGVTDGGARGGGGDAIAPVPDPSADDSNRRVSSACAMSDSSWRALDLELSYDSELSRVSSESSSWPSSERRKPISLRGVICFPLHPYCAFQRS